jgi:ribonuclease HII
MPKEESGDLFFPGLTIQGPIFPKTKGVKDMIIGIDEVGRGCIAGDLIVCAYAVSPKVAPADIEKLTSVAMDSKAFSSRKTRAIAAEVVRKFGVFEISRSSIEEIEKLNIRGATLAAMARAAETLASRVSAKANFLFDGRDIPQPFVGRGAAVVKGDATVLEISCASIIAKVYRDVEMEEAARIYPGYGFEKHAGYGTRQHVAAIQSQGLCAIHRSWAQKFCT